MRRSPCIYGKNTVTKRAIEGKHKDHVALGMLAGLGAFFMFTIMNVFAKLLSENHSVIEIAFYRNVIAAIPFLVMIFVFGDRDILVIRTKPAFVFSRAVLGTLSLTLTFGAYSVLPMAEATAFMFTASLFIPVLGVLFLKEYVGIYRWSAVLIGFVGVMVMLRPTGDVYVLGVSLALGAALMQAILQVILRHLGAHERPETITFYFFVIGVIITALAMPFVAVRPTLNEIPLLIGVGLSGSAAQWCLSTAFRNAPAAIVAVFNYSGIIWSTFFGWMIWNEWPLPIVFVGAAIVIASNLLMIWRENRVGRISDARLRAKL